MSKITSFIRSLFAITDDDDFERAGVAVSVPSDFSITLLPFVDAPAWDERA